MRRKKKYHFVNLTQEELEILCEGMLNRKVSKSFQKRWHLFNRLFFLLLGKLLQHFNPRYNINYNIYIKRSK